MPPQSAAAAPIPMCAHFCCFACVFWPMFEHARVDMAVMPAAAPNAGLAHVFAVESIVTVDLEAQSSALEAQNADKTPKA
mmetsp:Transcript_107592/g.195718  ORF Transcript_107592/g.195718 Transcript_107592/m.195718 type:complete len:80 (+) Transcript_107592:1962-2201(+)